MSDQPQRETAKICNINNLITGEYVVEQGWAPNYIKINGRKLSRINIIGFVVSKQGPHEFFIDDGSGTIQVIDFNHQKKSIELKMGDAVLIIGRPRQNAGVSFIACEIINNKQLLEEPSWISHRKKELQNIQSNSITKKSKNSVGNIISKNTDFFQKETKINQPQEKDIFHEEKLTADITGEDIVDFIKKKDDGEGTLIEDIISYFGKDIDNHILTLITMGEIYEIKPGCVKVLE